MPRSIRITRFAIAAIFFVAGVTFASWAARIPAIQESLQLDNSTLGSVLLGLTIGAMIAMPIVGWLIVRLGSRPVTVVATVILCFSLPLIAIASNVWMLLACLVLTGIVNGALDVAMNDQAVAVEKLYNKPIMSSFHALFSLGGMAGSAIGAGMVSWQIEPLTHFVGVAVVMSALALWALPSLLPIPPVANTNHQMFVRPSGALVKLAIIAFCVLLGEGAMADWSAVYLTQTVPDDPELAPIGYAAFSLAMGIGRLNGDWLIARFGPLLMLRLSGLLAAGGLSLALLFTSPTVVILAGFACAGFGFSTVVPIVFSAAGRSKDMPSSTALASVTTLGYFGFLAGPPIIGWGAGWITLRGSLAVVVVLSIMIAVLASSVKAEKS